MEVDIHRQVEVLLRVDESMLCGEDGRLVLGTWIRVMAIEILGLAIKAVVASVDAIWVQHRNDFKHVVVHQDLALLGLVALLTCQEVQNTVEDIGGWGLTGMYS